MAGYGLYDRLSLIALRFIGVLCATSWAVANGVFRAATEVWRFAVWAWQEAFVYPTATRWPVARSTDTVIDFNEVRVRAYEKRRLARLPGHDLSVSVGLRLAA